MRRSQKLMQGVTLLEIMLVLAIAAMVIVMSIRYYGQATNSQNANIILEEVTNVTQAAENLAQGPGTYASVNTATVTTIAGSKNMVTPYGASSIITVTGATTSYTVNVSAFPAAVCASVAAKLKANPKMVTPACSGTSGNVNLTYTYDSTK